MRSSVRSRRRRRRAARPRDAAARDHVLLDVQLPDQDGFALADILATDDQPPIVVLVCRGDRGASVKLAAPSARAFLPKGER